MQRPVRPSIPYRIYDANKERRGPRQTNSPIQTAHVFPSDIIRRVE